MTAVEYILNLVVGEDEQGKDARVKDTLSKSEIEEALRIYKEQIMQANEEGFHSGQSMAHNGTCSFESAKDYYNKTFKSE